MNKLITIFSIISCVLLLNSCKVQQMDQYPTSDLNRNAEESKKIVEAQREKTEINTFNDFGKPEAK